LFFVNENLMLFNFPSVCAGTVPYGRRPLFTGEKAKTGFFLYLYYRFAKGFLDLVFFNFGRYFSPLNRFFCLFFARINTTPLIFFSKPISLMASWPFFGFWGFEIYFFCFMEKLPLNLSIVFYLFPFISDG